ncbi:MAG: hypothetical protein R6V85_06220 [Polyangia bacterium]
MIREPAPRSVGLGVALVSLCLLTTELALTRLFSVTIWYHFAFLAISVALFGTGFAALFVHLIQKRLPVDKTRSLLARWAAALAAIEPLAVLVLLNFTPDLGHGVGASPGACSTVDLAISFVAAAAPFFAGGLAISLAMTRYSRHIHALYSWDLVGAGLGCLLVIPAMSLLGAPAALVAVGSLAAAAALLFAGPQIRIRPLEHGAFGLLGVALIVAAATAPLHGAFRVHSAKGLDLDRVEPEFNEWNSFSMVSVFPSFHFRGWGMSRAYDGETPQRKTLVIDMNAMTPLVHFSGDVAEGRHVMWDLSAFVHHVRPDWKPRKVCVIGAGGGRDVLAALVAGARRVTAVEINPLIVEDVMRGEYRDYTGGLYDRPDVEVIADDGRGVVRRSSEKYDIIHSSMVDTSAATAAGAYALTENSLYTVEAFSDYLDHLAPGGLLSASSVAMPGMAGGAGLAAIAWQALVDRGEDPSRQVVSVGTPWIERPGSTLHNLIIKNGPFDERELASVRREATRLRFPIYHLPGREPPRNNPIRRLLRCENRRELDRLMDGWPLDVSPATDDRPFFFYQNRLRDVGELISAERPAYLFGGGLFVLAKVALVASAMVILFLLTPFVLARRDLRGGRGPAAVDLAYVGCLGVGFMCIEIGLIQKLTVFLGPPTYTLAVVLLTLLLSGAAGSRLFGRTRPERRRRNLPIALAALVALVIALWASGAGDALLDSAVAAPLSARIAIAAALLAPTGLLLGMPYPAGLSATAERAPRRIPWLWGINSAASVLGSVSAVLISIHAGISIAILAGAGFYATALLLAFSLTRGRSAAAEQNTEVSP